MGSAATWRAVPVRVGDTWDYVFLLGVRVRTAVAWGETGTVSLTLRTNPR